MAKPYSMYPREWAMAHLEAGETSYEVWQRCPLASTNRPIVSNVQAMRFFHFRPLGGVHLQIGPPKAWIAIPSSVGILSLNKR